MAATQGAFKDRMGPTAKMPARLSKKLADPPTSILDARERLAHLYSATVRDQVGLHRAYTAANILRTFIATFPTKVELDEPRVGEVDEISRRLDQIAERTRSRDEAMSVSTNGHHAALNGNGASNGRPPYGP